MGNEGLGMRSDGAYWGVVRCSAPDMWIPRCLLGLLALLLFSRCTTDLDPFVEHERHFSAFGVLDASADSHFVRITPLRKALANPHTPLELDVRVVHLETGASWSLRDSVTTYPNGLVAHNFGFAAGLQPGAAYRLTIRGDGGEESTAIVRMPPSFPDPEYTDDPYSPIKYVKITGIERLVAARVIYHVFDRFSGRRVSVTVDYLEATSVTSYGYTFGIDPARDEEVLLREVGGYAFDIEAVDVFVAAAGPDWPDLTGIDPETLALPDVLANVEQGVGFVGGILSRTIRL